jgi:hypothetical protein
MKGQNGKWLSLYNTKQRPAAVLKKLENVLSGAEHRGHNTVGMHEGRAWKGATTHVLTFLCCSARSQ